MADRASEHEHRGGRVGMIAIEVSPGELVDRISILAIKAERFADPQRRATAQRQLEAYRASKARALGGLDLARAEQALLEVNRRLWDIEDRLRDREQAGRFDAGFIELARSVYKLNDRRAAIKKQVDGLFGAAGEDKEYAGQALTAGEVVTVPSRAIRTTVGPQ